MQSSTQKTLLKLLLILLIAGITFLLVGLFLGAVVYIPIDEMGDDPERETNVLWSKRIVAFVVIGVLGLVNLYLIKRLFRLFKPVD